MKAPTATKRARLFGTAALDITSHGIPNVVQSRHPLRRVLTGLAAAVAVLGLSQTAARAAAYLDTDGGASGFQAADGATYLLFRPSGRDAVTPMGIVDGP
jgi:hypothetical protein